MCIVCFFLYALVVLEEKNRGNNATSEHKENMVVRIKPMLQILLLFTWIIDQCLT